jgi:L,D-peptidoglycan transpeptidase YkuD (ErfK/YbiS/YcfS/YnhG family)
MKQSLFLLSLIFSLKLDFINSLTYDVSKLRLSKTTDQIMLVIPPNPRSYSAKFLFYVKNGNTWNEYIKSEAHIGKNGLGKQKEGDNKTPIGAFRFTKYFGVADNPGTKLPYVKLNEYHYWDGDSNSKKYNQFVDTREYNEFDKNASEHLFVYKTAYKYAMNINYNEKGEPHKGSAIFLHCYTNNPYTAGCVALPENNMVKVMKKVNKNCRIVIDLVQNIHKY